MKKVFLALLLAVFLSTEAYAIDFKIFDLRNKIFVESQTMKSALTNAKDPALVVSMFDTCLIVMSQIDAYFSMVGIFDSIRKEDMTSVPLDFIASWLNEMKKSSELSIKHLTFDPALIGPELKPAADRMVGYLGELNRRLDNELNKVAIMKKAVKSAGPR